MAAHVVIDLTESFCQPQPGTFVFNPGRSQRRLRRSTRHFIHICNKKVGRKRIDPFKDKGEHLFGARVSVQE